MGNEAKTALEDKVMKDLEENPMIEKPEEVLSKILKEGFDKTILLQGIYTMVGYSSVQTHLVIKEGYRHIVSGLDD
ncbi:hypothetical protein Tco_1300254 [Tanacetum coccineum]